MSFFHRSPRFNWFPVLSGLFVGILLISEITATKIIQLNSLILPAAVIIFPFSYVLGDVLTEVYGYAKARQVIWTGFIMMIVMVVVFHIVGKLPAAPFWQNQSAWDAIMGTTPRIVAASLVAFLAGGFSNSYVLAKMKITSKGKHLWKRTIGSTVVGEGLDTLIFISLAFGGTMPTNALVTLIVSQYIVKVLIEVVVTPVTYRVVGFLKETENEDVYDTKTDFSPLHF